MPSSKLSSAVRSASARTKTGTPARRVPTPRSEATDAPTLARIARTRAYLAQQHLREEELKKQGYCF